MALTGNPAGGSVANIVLPQGADAVTANYSSDSNYAATTYTALIN
jgi:hypothetical protein